MTKHEEIEAWHAFADSITEDSYTKDAIRILVVEVENSIKSDMDPPLSLADTRRMAWHIKQAAQNEAKAILEQAQKQADEIRKTAETKAEGVYRDLYDIQGKINRMLIA